jgi:regulation of enolase protein 1 (concanavalin A-like superfamily)
MRRFSWLLQLVSASSLCALLMAEDGHAPILQGWGRPVDPAGDCNIRVEAEKLKIDVPGTKHDLTVETGSMNAPRVLRQIDGDFIAQVLISGNIRHAGQRTSDRFLAYHGAGIVLWLNDQTYFRLERAGVLLQDGRFIHYVLFGLRKDGQMSEESEFEIPDRDTYLRLERRGNHIYGLASTDGITWSSCTPIAASLPKEVKVGVDAVNTSTEPLKVVFSELDIFKKEHKGAAK